MKTEQTVPLELAVELAEALETEIRHSYVSGMRWKQAEKAKKFHVSVSLMRMALFVLQKKGFVYEERYGEWVIIPSKMGKDMDYDPSLPSSVKLSNFLNRTFLEQRAELSVWCFTTEFLFPVLTPIITDIRNGNRYSPESITIRLILPDYSVPLGVPRSLDDPTDPRPQNRMRGIAKRFAIPMVRQIQSLQAPGHVVKVWIKKSPTLPPGRFYLNGEESLFGFYHKRKHTVTHNGEEMRILDVVSKDMPLIYYPAGTEQMKQNRTMFDSEWASIDQKTPLEEI
ncbi:hypothetical protein MK805_07315 [Shimazuella sp. AN120528]|uniref:hypothetical protein n=1 Tax=Shimazuella soli TaxID=1892854 RepID=UPI001F10C599|nr:hypothetical protein [Shimazuella soli]MCH5584780.1 hypothetical protein [Shimazuella soli]